MQTFELNVNGKSRTVQSEADRSLLEVLREELALSGTKYGCGEGTCRSCVVLLEGRPVTACRTAIGDAANRPITTIEGLAQGDELHPVQQAFIDEAALQCGYCVPGMILTAVALLEHNPQPSRAEIVEFMNGNLCRCCNYPNIVNAVARAAESRERAAS